MLQKKETKSKKKTTKAKIKEIEVTNKLNKSLLNELDTKEKIVDFDLEEEEEPEFETDFLEKTKQATQLKTKVKIEGIQNEIEQEKQLRLQQLAWDEENVIQKAIFRWCLHC